MTINEFTQQSTEKIKTIYSNSGIYAITNVITGEVYIGRSSNIYSRWKQHASKLRTNKHHSTKLQKAFDIYGGDCLDLSVLEFNPCNIAQAEVKYKELYNSIANGYDMPRKKNVRGAGRKRKFTDDVSALIKEKYQGGFTYSALAKEFNCSIGLIWKILNAS